MFGIKEQNAEEEASAIIAQDEGLGITDVLGLADMLLVSVVFPPVIPFVIAGAVIAAPFSMISSRLKRSRIAMPDSWYATVAATASADGKFFAGRLLDEKGCLTFSDAVRFIAIERAVEGIPEVTPRKSVEESIAYLVSYYHENRTLFDMAVSALASGAGTIADSAGKALKTGLHKLKVGF